MVLCLSSLLQAVLLKKQGRFPRWHPEVDGPVPEVSESISDAQEAKARVRCHPKTALNVGQQQSLFAESETQCV